jgi:hypothetical protein
VRETKVRAKDDTKTSERPETPRRRRRKRGTFVFREADDQRISLNLIREQILLVQEQDEVDVGKPGAIAYRVEQFQRFVHSVLKQ